MKFAHFADVHLGSWSDPKLAGVSTEAFCRAVEVCFENEVDFILLSGDFFDKPLPSIDCLKEAAKKLREIKERGIPVYAIAGSHDFSPNGKTMLDVLENAGLLKNVMKGSPEKGKLKLEFTVDEKTDARITGIGGRKGMLEREYFRNLARESLENGEGFRIFMFHTALSEFKPEGLEKMDSVPLSDFPGGFDYYAGGHVHEPYERKQPGYGIIANPGPLFPNNFREIEKLGSGGFYIVEKKGEDMEVSFNRVTIHPVEKIVLDCTNKSAAEIESLLIERASGMEFKNAIVTLRLHGKMGAGNPSDVDLRPLVELIYGKEAHFVMSNKSALTGSRFEEVKVNVESVEEAENQIIAEHLSKIKVEGLSNAAETDLVKNLMEALNSEKSEGESKATFERRVMDGVGRILKMDP